jgi:hypothetical protein
VAPDAVSGHLHGRDAGGCSFTATLPARGTASRSRGRLASGRRSLRRYTRAVIATRTALITGITGREGSYLAKLLLEKG